MHANISIIIPAYNNLSLFQRAFNSIITQTVTPKEIIVTDDSTSDDIKQWVESEQNPIVQYHKNNPSLGAIRNWNRGLDFATCDYVIVLHHDEELSDENYIERLLLYFDSSDIVISDIRIRINSIVKRGHFCGHLKRLLLKIPESILCINYIGPCACVAFRRSILKYFDSNLTWLVDTEWYYRLMIATRNIKYASDLCIISNHGHADQITSNIDIEDKNKEDNKYLKNKYIGRKKIIFSLEINGVLMKVKTFIGK